MIENDLKEKNFEAAIEQWLVAEGGYVKGNQATYDKERAIDLPTLIRFIDQTQHKKWDLFCRKHGANAESRCTTTSRMQYRDMALSMSCVMASMTWAST